MKPAAMMRCYGKAREKSVSTSRAPLTPRLKPFSRQSRTFGVPAFAKLRWSSLVRESTSLALARAAGWYNQRMAELYDDFEQRYGLVRIGGDLEPATLLEAYCTGVFPWFDEDCPICWWSPDPRALFELLPSPPSGEGSGVRGGFHVSRR